MTLSIVAILAALLITGLPIFLALTSTLLVYLGFATDIPLTILPQRMFAGIDNFTLTAIPFFNLAAEIMRAGRLADRLIGLARVCTGFLPGGLGIAAVLACMMFACISGSSPATVIAVGSVLFPALVAAGYSPAFAVGLLTTTGSLGILIPPSVTFIIYGVATGSSVGALFAAGVVPGLLVGAMFMVYCVIYARRNNVKADPIPNLASIVTALRESFWVLLLPVVVLGGIYGGFFTATEAAAVAATYSAILALFVYRSLTWGDLPKLLARSGLLSGALLLIIAGASAFSWLITSQDVPQDVTRWLLGITDNKYVVLLLLNLLLLVMGCFIESASAIVIMMPIIMPIAHKLDINLVHFGVVFTMNMEVGMVTPPVGLNLIVAKMITGMSLGAIVRASLPTLGILMLGLLIVTYVPWFSLALPRLFFPM
ncbi:MAG: TRAP transporter large permease subunit [Rhizobiales bacterium]|nr:TRAP transporter large permease subunit [Hyphomicrobiales bacterium]OJY45599.1 MAG: C4-dicarboxylate ABC transporter permease [Rhizobiales bacterium 64-17]